MGQGSSVGTATRYGLDRPGIEARLLRDNLQLSRPALVPIHPPIQWVPRHTVRKLSHLLLTAD